MHLISYGPKIGHSPFYQKRSALTRADSLPHIFRKLRIHRNLTKKALAEKFGVSEEYVSSIESGSKFPSLNFCLKCGDQFGANPGWVKTKWAKEAIERFSNRLMKRLGLDD
jgi:DNA-binding XRE family transcriptional regulator